MTPSLFRTTREALGLSAYGVAALLRCQYRTIHRWETGAWPVPEDAAKKLAAWDEQMAGMASRALGKDATKTVTLARWTDGVALVSRYPWLGLKETPALALELHHGLLARILLMAKERGQAVVIEP